MVEHEHEDETSKRELVWKVFLAFFALFLAVSSGLIGWLLIEVHDQNVAIVEIKSSSCPSSVCSSMRSDLSRIHERVDRMPLQIPPPDFRAEVTDIGKRVAVLEHICREKNR